MNSINRNRPIFVIGNPRSGTSLLRLILTSHSKVLIPPECGFVIWLMDKYRDWSETDNNTDRLNTYLDELFLCKKFDTWKLDKESALEKIIEVKPCNYAELSSVIYRLYGDTIAKKPIIWGDKNNFHLNYLDDLNKLYKNARFLHIVRDGRDVACSYKDVMKIGSKSPYAPVLPTDIKKIASEWSSNVMKIDNFISKVDSDSSKTVRYEDLVTNPNTLVRDLCAWLDIEYESRMLEFYKYNLKNKLEPDKTIDWKRRTLEPISNNTVGNYKKMLTVNELNEFSLIAQSTLRKFGYSLF